MIHEYLDWKLTENYLTLFSMQIFFWPTIKPFCGNHIKALAKENLIQPVVNILIVVLVDQLSHFHPLSFNPQAAKWWKGQ